MELEAARGKKGYVDLYKNDRQALEKTLEACIDRLNCLKLSLSMAEGKGIASLYDNVYSKEGVNYDNQFYDIKESMEAVEESGMEGMQYYPNGESESHKAINLSNLRVESSNSSSSSASNYDYIRLKYYFTDEEAFNPDM